jgi:ligand-binding SRPBCC domain-containing protein
MEFVKESIINASPERVFAFHELSDAFTRLMPPWEKTIIVQPPASLRVGARTIVETSIVGPIKVRWVAEHTAYDPPRMFEDIQLKGPFKQWRHRHIVKPHPQGAILRDEILYEPPLGPLGKIFAPLLVVPRLERMFTYRHEVTRRWCEPDSD